ncbi:MAG: GAF domain-containing protein [Flexilinea sp.]
MKTGDFTEMFLRINTFYQECLNLLKEMSLESLLHKIAVMASSFSDACYCVCGAVDSRDEFIKYYVSGFTSVELELMTNTDPGGTLRVHNIHSAVSINTNRIKDFPETEGFLPERHPFINTLLYIPIFYGGDKRGSIVLANKIGAAQFSAQDQSLIETLAIYAGIAINNAVVNEQTTNREQMLSKRNEDLALLNELAKLFATSVTQQETIVDETMRHVMGYLDIEVGEFFLRDDEDTESLQLIYREGHSLPSSIFGFSTVALGEGIIGITAETKLNYVLSKEEIEIINNKKATPVNLNYAVCLPLISNDGVLGVMCLATRLINGADSTINLQFLSSIASWVATLIQDIRLTKRQKRIAILEERERIGMDLHDGVIQSIYGVGLTLEHARLLAKKDPDQTAEKIKTAIDSLNATIRDIRSYIMNLKPARLTNENLIQSLRRLANDFHSNTLVDTEFHPAIEDINSLSEDHVNTFYLICKEALSNITKHAHATKVVVTFYEMTDRYILEIQDNGTGFDSSMDRQNTSHGISNMFARTRNLNGNIELSTNPGGGTMVLAWLPKIGTKKA